MSPLVNVPFLRPSISFEARIAALLPRMPAQMRALGMDAGAQMARGRMPEERPACQFEKTRAQPSHSRRLNHPKLLARPSEKPSLCPGLLPVGGQPRWRAFAGHAPTG